MTVSFSNGFRPIFRCELVGFWECINACQVHPLKLNGWNLKKLLGFVDVSPFPSRYFFRFLPNFVLGLKMFHLPQFSGCKFQKICELPPPSVSPRLLPPLEAPPPKKKTFGNSTIRTLMTEIAISHTFVVAQLRTSGKRELMGPPGRVNGWKPENIQ